MADALYKQAINLTHDYSIKIGKAEPFSISLVQPKVNYDAIAHTQIRIRIYMNRNAISFKSHTLTHIYMGFSPQ